MKETKKPENEMDAQVDAEVDIEMSAQKSSDKIAELTADLQRLRADFENYRKQTENQKEQAKNVVKFTTVLKFLPLLDDIDRAIATYPKELEPLSKSLKKTLEGLTLQKIDSREGVEFNPELHEAVLINEETEGEKDVIEETLRPGYFYEGVVARTAMVKVKKI